MDNLCLLCLLAICSYALAKIEISDLVVPQQLQHKNQTDITLDCKFEIQNANDINSLVIKWFFQKNQLIYQWIPDKEPQALGIIKNRIDLTYKASNDSKTMYRALKITNVTTDLTGEYTCQVSSLYNEATRSKQMTIFEPPKEFLFNFTTNSSEFLCSATEVFPKPLMRVYAYDVNLTQTEEEEYHDEIYDMETPNIVENDLHNVSLSLTFDLSKLTEPTVFACELIIPNTNYSRVINQTYYPEGEPTPTTSDYDYETSTISSVPGNHGYIKNPSTILLATFVFIFLLQHL